MTIANDMKKAINRASGFQGEPYAAPLVDVVGISQTDIICTSGQTERYGEGETDDWFNN